MRGSEITLTTPGRDSSPRDIVFNACLIMCCVSEQGEKRSGSRSIKIKWKPCVAVAGRRRSWHRAWRGRALHAN